MIAERNIRLFTQYALPGMAMSAEPMRTRPSAPAPPQPPRPLVRRCQSLVDGSPCGRPISNNKSGCMRCWKILLPKLQARIAEQLAAMPPEQWIPLLMGLDPELRPDELPDGYEMAYDILENKHFVRLK